MPTPPHELFRMDRLLCFVLKVATIYYFFSGVAALHHSSCNGHIEVCKFLIAAKADVNVKNYK